MPRIPTNSKLRGWAILPLVAIPAIPLRDLYELLGINGQDAWLATTASLALLCTVVHLANSALDSRDNRPTEREFEFHIADLCRRDGLLAVQVAPDANVKAYLPNGSLVLIRCGPTDHEARPLDLHHFIGTAHHEHHADIPVFVTIHGFTTEARQFARHHGIVLLDQPRLGQWQQGHGLTTLVGTTH
ncbi:restriction endonuclease [Embleya sp. NBC_00896]|uniref:restriction endonuclease n=1 Tax=Embleya sp. NBC_00896 TaxID=2975961 RepID=UPI003867C787|nr:restriction endonuclease [Embleya sp. NBC_00896]